ncbi:UDP-N-acetylmuramate dehydrogenase [Microvirgula aerodenitrificans]|uniref:UDP-N-acetylmuramate dehydrogenase n=1 Tax=Microvirgula aerodenitrificans TaxID=57480 RepID=UPI00248DCF1C|nr:UDP-N-acetylmuramate dehydrogenase [Microvirgula aerodenitrificans]
MTLLAQHDVALAPFTTFGVPAQARRLVHVSDEAALAALLDDDAFRHGPRLVLGGGSNVLFTRDFPGTVARIELKGITVIDDQPDTVQVRVAAGEIWHDFVRSALAHGWFGLENLSLIPGTVGASPVQNIGAYGTEAGERIVQVDAVEIATGTLHHFDHAGCRFGYRDSVFKREWKDRLIITAVHFRLDRHASPRTGYGDISRELDAAGIVTPTPLDVSDAVCRIRAAKLPDPARLGNAGSFFKNPVVTQATADRLHAAHPGLVSYPHGAGLVKLAAGWLIDHAGLKGLVRGQAAVHDRQALVLVNRGGASGEEVLALARHVQQTVRDRYDVEIEPEPIIL